MHLPQSQNKNINNMCIVGNPVHIISEQGDVKRCKNPTLNQLWIMLTVYFLIT